MTATETSSSVTPHDAPPAAVAVVRSAVAPLHAEPRVASGQLSQALGGHPLLIHAEQGDWLRVAGTDGYAGWMHRGYATYLSDAAHAAAYGVELTVAHERRPWLGEPTWLVGRAANRRAGTLSLGCTVRGPRGRRTLPLGAWVEDAGDGPDARGPEVVEAGDSVPLDAVGDRFPNRPAAVAASARTLFAGTSYQWGGCTPWGADCSGFVQAVYALHGCPLPRDAWQQALVGDDVGTDIAAVRPADLLFFSDREDGRITHVGVALGDRHMAHVALGRGGHAVDRLDDAADPYVARLGVQLRSARRVLGG